jgi:hypothetical protein
VGPSELGEHAVDNALGKCDAVVCRVYVLWSPRPRSLASIQVTWRVERSGHGSSHARGAPGAFSVEQDSPPGPPALRAGRGALYRLADRRLVSLADAQPTALRKARAAALICLGAGAGLCGGELAAAKNE